MTFNLTTFDQNLAESVILRIGGTSPVSGFPGGGATIKFQFPPIIKTEKKKIDWRTLDKGMLYESYYLWAGGRPRTISLLATYIVGGPPVSGIKWTAENVAREVRRYKSYFYNQGLKGAFLPVFVLDMYQHAPGLAEKKKRVLSTTWRGEDVTFKYSDSLVSDGTSKSTFPLRTDVTLRLVLTTRIQTEDGQDVYGFRGKDQPPGTPPQEWY